MLYYCENTLPTHWSEQRECAAHCVCAEQHFTAQIWWPFKQSPCNYVLGLYYCFIVETQCQHILLLFWATTTKNNAIPEIYCHHS